VFVALLLFLYGVLGAVCWFFNGDLLALLMLVCVAFEYYAGLCEDLWKKNESIA